MHDRYGKEIEEGDIVVGSTYVTGNKPTAMKVINCFPGSDTCNISCGLFETRMGLTTMTAKETTLVVKKDGSIIYLPQENKET